MACRERRIAGPTNVFSKNGKKNRVGGNAGKIIWPKKKQIEHTERPKTEMLRDFENFS